MRRGEAFYSPTSRYRSFSESATLDCELHNFLPLGWIECLNMGWSWVFCFPTQVGSDNVFVLVAQLSLCNPMEYSPPGSSVHGIFQVNILEWVSISSSRGPSRPRDRTQVSHIAGRCFNLCATREAS